MARKLKKFVIPTGIGIMGLTTAFTASIFLNGNNDNVENGHRYTISEIKEKIIPVIDEVVIEKPIKPFLEETVGKSKDYYRKDDDEQTQQNSLIYYEKTYMPSTGILYSSEEGFDVVASLDGIVKKIGDDNILGKYVVIEHDNGYKSVYYSLGEVTVQENNQIVKGDVIATSGENKMDITTKYNLLFEIYHDGYLMDPEDFYNIDFTKSN